MLRLDCEPEYAAEYAFVESLVHQVPEMRSIWEAFEADWGEFIPTTLMYDIARGLVSLARDVHQSGKEDSAIALVRAYSVLEEGLSEPTPSPIPALIRMTMGDWLGRQALEPDFYAVLCESMGPILRSALHPMTVPKPVSVPPAEPSSIPVAEPSSEVFELQTLHRKEWSYAAVRIPGTNRIFLHVLCGTVGIYDVTVELNSEELAELQERGTSVIDEWAQTITQQPDSVRSRQIRLPDSWTINAIGPGLWASMEQTERDYQDWAEKNGVLFEQESLPAGVDVAAWGWRMIDKRPRQLWVVMKSDPMDLGELDQRIERLCAWSSEIHKARAGWAALFQKPLRLCIVILTGSVASVHKQWVWNLDYFQRRRGVVRHVFVLDHSTGQVCRQQNVSKIEQVASLSGGMDSVHQRLERYMERYSTEDSAKKRL